MAVEFEDRERFPLQKAKFVAARPGKTRHVLDNGDGTYSVMSHLVCEWCDYCDEGGPGPFAAKADPYENQWEES